MLEECSCLLVNERNLACADVESLNTTLTKECAASQRISTQLEKAVQDIQASSDCVIASKNACKVLAQVLETCTVALERKRNTANACADTSVKKANTAGQDASKQKACANSIAAKSQEVESRLCNKLQTKHECHQQLQLVALQKAAVAEQSSCEY
jgi:hypothetical protein